MHHPIEPDLAADLERAAEFLRGAERVAGARVIEVNLTRTEASAHADVTLCGPAGQVLPDLVQRGRPNEPPGSSPAG